MSRSFNDHADAEQQAMPDDLLAELVARAEAADERDAEAMRAAWDSPDGWPTSEEIAEFENHMRRAQRCTFGV